MKAEDRKLELQRDFIVSDDPKAQNFLRNLYERLSTATDLSAREKEVLKEVEDAYLNLTTHDDHLLEGLLQQAKDILNVADEIPWNTKLEHFHQVLEEIVFKLDNEVYANYFKSIEQTISAAIELNFQQKAEFVELPGDRRNILNYAAVSLNDILSNLKVSVTSNKAFNTILQFLPDVSVLIVDENGLIRFINEHFENEIENSNLYVVDTNIEDYLKDASRLISDSADINTVPIRNMLVTLELSPDNHSTRLLSILTSSHEDQVVEYIFMLSKNDIEVPGEVLGKEVVNFKAAWEKATSKIGSKVNLLSEYKCYYNSPILAEKRLVDKLFHHLIAFVLLRKDSRRNLLMLNLQIIPIGNSDQVQLIIKDNTRLITKYESSLLNGSKVSALKDVVRSNEIIEIRNIVQGLDGQIHAYKSDYGNIYQVTLPI